MKNKKSFFYKTFFGAVFFLSAFLFCACKSSQTANANSGQWNTNYDFVFVHGLSGWGHYDSRNKFFPYWGMKNGSLMKQLKKEGFKTYDASVAPHGSAWDRACELYAQLTGTVTDYGVEHSERCGHPRFGRDFSKEPLIPVWDSQNKINLLGHSFGGVTVRLLAHLMAQGAPAEQAATAPEDLSPLFAGGHADWIYSVTTLAAPHNGTSVYHIPVDSQQKKSTAQKLMDKTNTPKKDGRADFDYAAFDMHIQNAREINKWLTTPENLYYFSYACSATKQAADGSQEPDPDIMDKLFRASALRMGRFEGTTYDDIYLSKDWQENDGLVNTISALAPEFAPAKEYPETTGAVPAIPLEKGVWYIMPVYKGDHMSLQGGFTKKHNMTDFYIEHLSRINSL